LCVCKQGDANGQRKFGLVIERAGHAQDVGKFSRTVCTSSKRRATDRSEHDVSRRTLRLRQRFLHGCSHTYTPSCYEPEGSDG
jgi:hypothetical protein